MPLELTFVKDAFQKSGGAFKIPTTRTLLQFVKNAYAKPVAGAEKKKEGDEKEDTADQLEAVDLKIKIR